eukprot:Nk52_evm1s672 gene=Nk52_evmTU1s672
MIYWDRCMEEDVKWICKRCNVCQRNRPSKHFKVPLRIRDGPQGPMERLQMDFVDFNDVDGYVGALTSKGIDPQSQ